MKTKIFRSIFLVLGLIIVSCSSDDTMTPVSIKTNPDNIVIAQNSEVDIFMFLNDENIPSQGQFSISNPSKGIVTIQDSSTPDDLADDFLIYTANNNDVGLDTFQYTICDNNGDCKTETISVEITSSSIVNFFTGDTPFETLSAYNFFEGNLKELNPTFGVIPYDLMSPLFTDYAYKKRFIWMPNGVKATYVNDYSPLDFPTGSVLIKSFFYENVLPNNDTKIIETRIMYKKEDGWDFAKYVWNDEQTEAYFDNNGSNLNLSWLEDGDTKTVNYRIPSRGECFTCHNKFETPLPIGPKPQNLNRDYNYATGASNQLSKLIEIGYLENSLPESIQTTVKWDDENESLEMRVRSYLDINCAHCHSDNSYCEYRSMRFGFRDSAESDNLGVCIEPETQFIPNSNIVQPNNIELSILYYRINTTDESFRMPLFGRTLKHEEGVRLVEEWIASLNNCD
ncbi:Ig-like domain-containing protein [Winogradskyella sp.]|uniref:Ig-like domain-containing protein n=1 Tax=Winogradskyella sp. TaxID=1883156 RepID=UPI003F6B76A5